MASVLPDGLLGITPFFLMLPPAVWLSIEAALWLARRDGVDPKRFVALQLALVPPAIVGTKVWSIAERGWVVGSLEQEIVSGWRQPGGLLALGLCFPLLRRWFLPQVSIARYGDYLAMAVVGAVLVLRTSCLMNGCCTGNVCASDFCLAYSAGSSVWHSHVAAGLIGPSATQSLPVFPLHLFLLAVAGAVGGLLVWLEKRRTYDGQILLTFLVAHEGAKFILEFFREPQVSSVQLASLVAFTLGMLGLLWMRRRLWVLQDAVQEGY